MNSLILSLVILISGAALAKPAAPETAHQMVTRAKTLAKKGDPQGAKKVFEQVLVKHSTDALDGGLAEDVDIGGAAAVNTYGDLVRHEMKFIELELSQGKNRIFPDAKLALEDILTHLDLNEITEVRDKMWVRMEQGPCDSELDEMTPDEAMEELRLELAPKNVKVKNFSAGSTAKPTLKIALKTDRFLELQMSKYGKGWIWNKTVICSKAL